MEKTCTQCSAAFEITNDDLEFYDRISPIFNGKKYQVPAPRFCPHCRQQRRATFRNERNLYHRKSDLSGKQIISMYSPDKPYVVYEQEEWWSDQWDPLEYGRDFDFSKSFFEQFQELQLVVPRIALYQKNVENSAYTNHTEKLKNCYICADTADSQNIYYSKWILRNSQDLCDCYQMEQSQLCYESLYGVANYNCLHIFLSDNCRDSAFLYDCIGCKNCLMCWGLRQQKYCILNKQYTQKQYEEILSKSNLGSYTAFEKAKERFFAAFQDEAIHKGQTLLKCQDCSGDFLYNCKNVHESFEVIDSEDCKYCYEAAYLKDCYDTYEAAFNCELQYDSYACNRGNSVLFGHVSYDVDSVMYVDSCHNSSHLFGCVGLRHKQYCILNKQYTQEEYEELVPKIIEHMRQISPNPSLEKRGTSPPPRRRGLRGIPEWGEFFPTALSPFAYNESIAQEYFPLKKEEVEKNGWQWYEGEEKGEKYLGPEYTTPDTIADEDSSICDHILKCVVTGKPYKIIPQELKLYQQMGIPIPRKCPDQRHKERMGLRNPRILFQRECDKCGQEMRTTYHPSRPEKVFCESCYLKNVY